MSAHSSSRHSLSHSFADIMSAGMSSETMRALHQNAPASQVTIQEEPRDEAIQQHQWQLVDDSLHKPPSRPTRLLCNYY